jgi:hypothetical protein
VKEVKGDPQMTQMKEDKPDRNVFGGCAASAAYRLLHLRHLRIILLLLAAPALAAPPP